MVRRVARIWKRGGGGYFERVRKVQTTLTRIFILLESVSLTLSENSDEISWNLGMLENSQGFFRSKLGGLQKKKKRSSPKLSPIFRPKSEFQRFFPPNIKWSPKKKKKKVFNEIQTDFAAKYGNFNVWEGAVFKFSPKICLRSNENVRFCILLKPMGWAIAPPAPPGNATRCGWNF